MSGTIDPRQAVIDRRPKVEAVSCSNHWIVFEGGVVMSIEGYYDEDKRPMDSDFREAWYYGIEITPEHVILVPSTAYYMPSYSDH